MFLSTESKLYDYSLYYRNWHDDSDEHAATMARSFRGKLTRVLPPPGEAAVLDIGCGMGFALLGLLEAGFSDISGIDTDPQQVAACQRRGLRVECISDSAAFLHERLGRYDVVLLLDVLEHVPVADQIPFIRAVRQSLKPGGRVVLQTPNALSILASWQRYGDYTHHSSFSQHSLTFVLQNAGFKRVEIDASEPLSWRPPLRLWDRSSRREARRWLIRRFWREVLSTELGPSVNLDKMSLELNLFGVAYTD